MKTQSDLNEDIIHLMIKLIPERNKKKDKQNSSLKIKTSNAKL